MKSEFPDRTSTGHAYAQTNLQLDIQLTNLGYSDKARVQRAYGLAMQLFTGRYRANGKVFIAHLVGTASILARQGGTLDEVIAGLLHAVYLQGEFGDGGRGITQRRRRSLRMVVTQEVDALLGAYTELTWNPDTISKLREQVDELSAVQRSAVLLRLANSLEDDLDLGVHYCGKASGTGRGDSATRCAMTTIAEQLGFTGLARELAQQFAAQRVSIVPETLRNDSAASFTVAPYSHRRKWSTIVRGWLRKLSRRVS